MSNETSDTEQSDHIPEILVIEQHTDDGENMEEEEDNSVTSEIPDSSVLLKNAKVEIDDEPETKEISQPATTQNQESTEHPAQTSTCCLII